MTRSWKEARRKVDTEGACRVCRSWRGIEAAHIVPRSLGGEQKPDSIVPLCRQCHQAYDEFDLDILPHLTKDEQAEAVRVVGITRALARLCPSHNQKKGFSSNTKYVSNQGKRVRP